MVIFLSVCADPLPEILLKNKIPEEKYRIHYRKWLRYYRDFCHKYGHCAADRESLPLFAEKLRQKRQASHAVALYYESAEKEHRKTGPDERNAAKAQHLKISGNSVRSAGVADDAADGTAPQQVRISGNSVCEETKPFADQMPESGNRHKTDPVPENIQNLFDAMLIQKGISERYRIYYRKWLRYYPDFCGRYGHCAQKQESLPLFEQKLRHKRQSDMQIRQAGHAVALYHEIVSEDKLCEKTAKKSEPPVHIPLISGKSATAPALTRISEKNKASQTSAPKPESWQSAYTGLSGEIRVRHYSPKTFRVYANWLGQFQTFTKSKALDALSDTDMRDFLTHLAVSRHVSASTQNQAFNALLFFFRHVLKREPGEIKSVRAKRRPCIPVVLSGEEAEQIIKHLSSPYDLAVKLLYGCGLRLFACLKPRLRNFNFDAGILTVHDGKGQKDRTVPLPRSVMPELLQHLEKVKEIHAQDLAAGYAGTFMPEGLPEKKYKNCAKELIWQWFFPAMELTEIPESRELRRWHLHERHVQRAIRDAGQKARMLKRVSAHTLRHSFATHLLQANYDIRTIQELPGHSDVRSAMICTHAVKSRTIKETKSPLDFQTCQSYNSFPSHGEHTNV